ncbi:MAG: SurA N-terminal domain-containing protein [Vicinamibacterales bacterium]
MERAVLSRFVDTGVVMGVLALAAACGGSGRAPSAPDVWAVVNGTELRRDHVERLYRTMLNADAGIPTEEEALSAKLSILEDMINDEILIARATGLKIAPTDDEITKAVADQRGQMTEEAFVKQLGDRRITPDEFRQEVRRELTVRKVVEKEVTEKVVVADAEVTAFYEKNRAQFNVLERQYHLAQIVVNSQPNPQVSNRRGDDAATAEQAQRKVTMLTERLRTGDSFADLAMDFSEDPQSSAQGGDIGFVPQSRIDAAPPQLRQAVMAMKSGQVSTVTAGTQVTILALVAVQEPGQREISNPEVKEAIQKGLKDRRLQLMQNAFMSRVRNESTVVNYLAKQIVDGAGKATDAATSK